MHEPADTKGEPQKVEITGVKLSSSRGRKRALLVCACAFVVIALSVGAYLFIQSQREAAERSEYIQNLESIRSKMLIGAAFAEGLCNLTSKVWYNSIHEERDSSTDSFTRTSSGKFHDDFNTALVLLASSDDTISKINKIEENQAAVSDLYKELQNPSEEFELCFSAVDSAYSAYFSLTELAVSPTGSYNSYSTDCRESDTEFMEFYEKLNLLIPEN
jgi:hypothetical protein